MSNITIEYKNLKRPVAEVKMRGRNNATISIDNPSTEDWGIHLVMIGEANRREYMFSQGKEDALEFFKACVAFVEQEIANE